MAFKLLRNCEILIFFKQLSIFEGQYLENGKKYGECNLIYGNLIFLRTNELSGRLRPLLHGEKSRQG